MGLATDPRQRRGAASPTSSQAWLLQDESPGSGYAITRGLSQRLLRQSILDIVVEAHVTDLLRNVRRHGINGDVLLIVIDYPCPYQLDEKT